MTPPPTGDATIAGTPKPYDGYASNTAASLEHMYDLMRAGIVEVASQTGEAAITATLGWITGITAA